MIRNLLLAIVLAMPLAAFSQADGDFQTHQSGSWSTPSTWERFDGVSWVTPAPYTPTDADGITTILSGHTVTITADVSTDDATIDVGGSIILNSGINLTVPDFEFADALTINGTLTNNGIFNAGILTNIQVNGTFANMPGSTFNNSDPSWIFFNSGSTYNHAYAVVNGDIPLATWDVASTCLISGYTTNTAAPNNLNQEFGNFTWNTASFSSASPTFINLGGQLTTVDGNLRIMATGTTAAKQLQFQGTGGAGFTLNIGGNLLLDAGTITFVLNASSPTTVNIDGNYSQTLANVVLTQTAGDITFNIGKNFTKTGGTLSRVASGVATLNFNGVGVTQLYTYSGTAIASAVNYSVSNSSVLDLGTSALTGTGSFTLSPSSTLKVGSLASVDVNGAIQNLTTAGNIRVPVANRFYSSAGTIVYNGAGAQKIGNGFPSNVNLEIANTSGVTNNNIGVTNFVGTLTLTSGALIIGSSNTLNIQSDFITSGGGTIGGSSSSNLTFSGAGTMGTLSFAAGTEFLNNLTVSRTGDLVLGSNLTVAGTISLSAGNLDFSGHTLTMNGPAITSSSNGLKSNNNSTLTFSGAAYSGAIPFVGAGNQLKNLTFSVPSGTFTWNSTVIVNNTLTIGGGALTHSSGLTMATGSTILMSGGSISGLSPIAVTSYNVNYTANGNTGVELPSSGTGLQDLTINSSGTVTLTGGTTVNGVLTFTGGTFNAGSNALTLKGNVVSNSSSTLTSSAITFAGTTAITGSTTPVFGAITITGTLTPSANFQINGNIVNNGTLNAGTATTTFGGNTTISGSSVSAFNNITVSGTLVATAGTMNIAGNFINNGTFNHNNGTVGFNGSTTVSGSAASNFFAVSISGTLTAPTSTILGIGGNLTNSGTFNSNSGTVALNGTVLAQTISGSAITFTNINVTNPVPPGVGINSSVRLNGILTLSASGIFDADGPTNIGTFIVSSSSQIAGGGIATLPTPANFSGNVTVERFIQGKTGGDYRYLSMPITNGNVSMFKSSIFVTGTFTDHSTHADNANINDAGNTNASVFTYNSTTQAYVDVSGSTTAATALPNNVGYSAYDFNDGNVIASYRGTIGKGSVVVTISSTPGNFDLIPNPYPSAIDWDNVTKTNVNNAMYLRVATNVFSSYVGGVATNPPFPLWTGEVATGQSFFTSSSGSGTTLTLKEADKTSNAFYFLRTKAADNYFRVQLASAAGQQDEVVIHFVAGATDDMDSEFDAPKMRNGNYMSPDLGKSVYLNLSTYLNPGIEFSVNTMGILSGAKIVNLNVADVKPGDHSLNFSDLSKMNLGYRIILVDNYLGKEVEIKDNSSYDFTVDKNAKSLGASRFYLIINGTAMVTGLEPGASDLKVYPNPVSDKLMIELSAEQESSLKQIGLFDILGHPMVSSQTDGRLMEPGIKTIEMSGYASGVYILNVRFGDIVKSIRVIKK